MNEQRTQAYLNLIQQLLDCPQGEENNILRANAELVDGGLVQVMEQVATMMEQQGEGNPAWLRNVAAGLSQYLQQSQSSISVEDYTAFLQEVLQTIWESNNDPQVVYSLLQQHLDKLDDNFAQILQQWARNAFKEGNSKQVATLAGVIGSLCIDIYHFPLGNRAINLEIAITGYKTILEVMTRSKMPMEWAIAMTCLANAYSDRIRGEKAENMEEAIAAHRKALEVMTPETMPLEWAQAMNDLGAAYAERICGERAENIEQAIAAYHQVLKVRTREAMPVQWAQTVNNLGFDYIIRIRGERAENIEQAIAACQQALEVRTREAMPVQWSQTMNNLGQAYVARIRGERAENIEQAIAAYKQALEVRTREAMPVQWAQTRGNLGSAYVARIRGKRAENLERAITALKFALSVYTCEAHPHDWAVAQNNLGIAYSDRIWEEKEENLEKAIAAYKAALSVYTPKAFPEEWAGTQNNLGNAYLFRIRGEKGENLEKAITYYEATLQVFTPQAFPQEWAKTQDNLGNAYQDRILGEKGENLEKAIAYYQDALEVYTREAFPYQYARTLSSLGITYQALRDSRFNNVPIIWLLLRGIDCMAGIIFLREPLLEAYRCLAEATDTVEFLRGEIRFGSANEEDKRKLAEDWNGIYRSIVEVCLRIGKDCEAIKYVELSRTRNLVESLATRTLYPEGEIPPEVRQQLQQLQQEIEEEKRRLSAETSPDYSHLNDLRQQYNQLYPEISLSFAQIPPLLDGKTAIIEWYLFNDCFCAFLITRDSTQPQVWTSTARDLEALKKWVNPYLAENREFQQSKKTLMSRLEQLAQLAAILHINELISLLPSHIDQLVLIPDRHLHFLPLHALPVKSNKGGASVTEGANLAPLLDKFPRGVRYIPSCQLLQKVQERQRPDFSRLLGIETPTPDLYDDSPEKVYQADWGTVAAIKKQFTHPQTEIIRRDKATKSAILDSPDRLQAANCLLFFCHGDFNFKSPLDSGLELADGKLTLEEIIGKFNLKNCRLVTLSACETGQIDISNNSDEYIGLPFGFLLAGSTNVVASLWSVSATATALLMAKFYQELQQPQANITVALKTAQNWLRQTTVAGFREWLSHSQFSTEWQEQLKIKYLEEIEREKGATYQPFSSPYYWAAFCVIGKGV